MTAALPTGAEDKLAHVAKRARAEANAGAPAAMVAVYVEVEVRHLLDGHDGDAMDCVACHDALGDGRFGHR